MPLQRVRGCLEREAAATVLTRPRLGGMPQPSMICQLTCSLSLPTLYRIIASGTFDATLKRVKSKREGVWSKLYDKVSRERNIPEDDLSPGKALELYWMSLTDKEFQQVLEQIENQASSRDGLADDDWVKEFDREKAVNAIRNRQRKQP